MAKARQQHLPTLEPERIPALESLAEKYVEARDRRMQLGQKEQDAQVLLAAKMKEKGLTRYEFDGRVITVEATEKVKVKKAKDEADETEE